ncbi:MAG: HAD-IA family hydrolase [Lachnospiraceae bacterium]|nr:HAD-IA family hydrolase [Lachnospiraceae bacterium]
MIKAVVFDMFETLTSLFEGRTYFSEHMAADLNLSPDEFREAWHETETGRTCGEYTIEEGISMALKSLGSYCEENVRLLADKRDEMIRDSFDSVPKESMMLLKQLKDAGIKIGLISNCYSDEREYIKNSPFYPYFDVALLSYEQGVSKPDPEIFHRMTERLGFNPPECLYVGDGGSNELFAASEFGMKAVQTLVFHEMAYEPHVPCYSLPEFPHVYKQEEILKYLSD